MRDLFTTEKMMLYIIALDPEASVQCSKYTQKWYVQARVEISDGVICSGITSHEDTIDDAIAVYFETLTEVPSDKVIVTYFGSVRSRREWYWNGAAFAEVTGAAKILAETLSTKTGVID